MKNFIVCMFGFILILGASAQNSYQVLSGTTSSSQYPAADGHFTGTLTISPTFTYLGRAQFGCYAPYFTIGGPSQYRGTAVMHIAGPGFSTTESGMVTYGNCGSEVSIAFADNSFYDLFCWPQYPFAANDNVAPVIPMIGPCSATGGIQTQAFGYVSFTATPNGNSVLKLLGDPTGQCPCAGVGEPIHVATGNLFEKAVDYTTAGNNPLEFVRFYNSQADPSSPASSLGNRWRSNVDRYIRLLSAGTYVIAERTGGQELSFAFQKSGWISDSDVDVSLTNSGATWTLTDHDDTVEIYTAISTTEARLSTSRNRNGYTQTFAYNSSNQLISVTDSYGRSLMFSYVGALLHTVTTPDGLVLTYGFTSSGNTAGVLDRLASVTYSTSPQTSQEYLYENASFPLALTGITDENGSRFATWTFDSSERAVSSYMGQGADKTTISYDDVTGNRTVTNALGQQTIYKFTQVQGAPRNSEMDRLATPTTAAAKRTFSYDTMGYLSGQTDWNGAPSTYMNNIHGQPTTIVEALGSSVQKTTTITYDSVWQHLPAAIVAPGLTTGSTYDASGNPLTRTLTDTTTGTVPYSTNGQARTWTFTWGNFGLLATVKGPRTDVDTTMHYAYASGVLGKITNALGQSIQITKSTPGGLPLTIVDANGVTTNLAYDGRQRLKSRSVVTSAGVLTTSFGIDPAGNQVQVTLPDGSSLTSSFDAAHRLTQFTNSLGDYIQFTLDALGDRIHTGVYAKDGTLNWQRTSTPDALGRELARVTGTAKIPVKISKTYDSDGNTVTVQDGLGNTVSNSYDALNRPHASTDANNGVTALELDANDLPLTFKDANGNATMYTRNGFGEVTQQTSPDSGVTIFRYDQAGNLITKTDALGIVVNHTFDALNRPSTTTYLAHPVENITYAYDQAGPGFSFGAGRLTSLIDAAGSLVRTYDEQGNLLIEKRVNGSTTLITAHTYDPAGRETGQAYPDGTLVSYARDAAGQVITVTAKLAGTSNSITLAKFAHRAFGPINSATLNTGISEIWVFDDAGRPTTIVDTLSGVPLQSLAYGYDAADNVSNLTDAVNPANTQTFAYDSLGRMKGATSAPGGYGTFQWQYDPVGNRLLQLLNGAQTTYKYTPGTNRLATISPGSPRAAAELPALMKRINATAVASVSIPPTSTTFSAVSTVQSPAARPTTASTPADESNLLSKAAVLDVGPAAKPTRHYTAGFMLTSLTPATYIVSNKRQAPAMEEAAWSGYSKTKLFSKMNARLVPYLGPPLLPPSGTFFSPVTVNIVPTSAGAAIFYTTNGSIPTTASATFSAPLIFSSTTTLRAIQIGGTLEGIVAGPPPLSSVATATYTIAPAAAAPQFSLPGGTFSKTQTVTLLDTTPGSVIYFTTDGSTPTAASLRYTGSIAITSTETIQAIALASGYSVSGVAGATYKIVFPPTATPQLFPAGGPFTTVQTVTLTDATPGAIIYFTADGSTPSTASTRYTGPLTVSSTETIQAIALANGYSASSTVSGNYTINLPVTASPRIVPLSGTVFQVPPFGLTLSDTTPGAIIYYTLDDSAPTTSSLRYTGIVFVNLLGPISIKAIAVAPGYQTSRITWTSFASILSPPPSFSPSAGTVAPGQTVTLSVPSVSTTSNPGVPVAFDIYYTIDGSTPTTLSTLYTGPIPITASETITAITAGSATTRGVIDSTIVVARYSLGASSDMTVTTNAAGNITGIPSADGVYYLDFSYNNAGRTSTVSGGPLAATSIYDWAGQRYSKTNNGIPATVYSYGQHHEIIAENDAGVTTDYVYVDGRPIAQLWPSAAPGSQVSFVLADRLGTPQRLVSNTGNTVWSTAYQPFGTTGAISATANQNLRFPGQFADAETGFSYNLNRDYMPNLGRFLESDPIGQSGGADTYSYVNNTPLSWTDRSGLQAGGNPQDFTPQNRVSPVHLVDPATVQETLNNLTDGPSFWGLMGSGPTIITLSGSVPGLTGSFAIDKYGHLYGGLSGDLEITNLLNPRNYGINVSAGWLVGVPDTPLSVKNFVSGESASLGGYCVIGGSVTKSTSSPGTMINVGFGTPMFTLSGGNTWESGGNTLQIEVSGH